MDEVTRIPTKERDSSLDTLKCILIFFVVFGHVLEEVGVTGFLGTVRAMVYCFHMPVFVFLSGYFSKDITKASAGVLKGCAIPFFVYNTIYCLIVRRYDFLTPQYLYWYLLSLCFWRMSVGAFSKVKYILPISIAIALYAGTIEEADRFLAIQRTLCFFPFFWAGVLLTPERLEKWKKLPAIFSFGTVAFCELIVVIMSVNGFMLTKSYEMIEPYDTTNIVGGIVCRSIVLSIGFLCIFGIISLSRCSCRVLSKYGKRTASILVYSGFVVNIVSKIVYRIVPNISMASEWLVMLISPIVAFIVIIICGNHWVYSIYENTNNNIYVLLCRPPKRESDKARLD